MKKRLLGTMLLASTIATNVCAQQLKEKLNRAPVAVKTSTGVLVSWRSFSADAEDLSFNVYRNGTNRDISHLYANNEPPAFAARFCEAFENGNERHD